MDNNPDYSLIMYKIWQKGLAKAAGICYDINIIPRSVCCEKKRGKQNEAKNICNPSAGYAGGRRIVRAADGEYGSDGTGSGRDHDIGAEGDTAFHAGADAGTAEALPAGGDGSARADAGADGSAGDRTGNIRSQGTAGGDP